MIPVEEDMFIIPVEDDMFIVPVDDITPVEEDMFIIPVEDDMFIIPLDDMIPVEEDMFIILDELEIVEFGLIPVLETVVLGIDELIIGDDDDEMVLFGRPVDDELCATA